MQSNGNIPGTLTSLTVRIDAARAEMLWSTATSAADFGFDGHG